MKTCFKCGQSKSLDGFYRHPMMADGHLNKCKTCTKLDVMCRYAITREARAAYERKRFKNDARKAKVREYTKRRRATSPHKVKAYQAVASALKSKRLTRQPCEICGEVKTQAHHEDYHKPLDVRWLCFKHHREAHGQRVIAA